MNLMLIALLGLIIFGVGGVSMLIRSNSGSNESAANRPDTALLALCVVAVLGLLIGLALLLHQGQAS